MPFQNHRPERGVLVVLGGVLVVRNEKDWLQRNLRWHLDVQGFDFIVVADNGSYDGTVKLIKEFRARDDRVLFRPLNRGVGFAQDAATLLGMRELVDKLNCDWVLPIDADELWHSREFGTVRSALEYASVDTVQVDTFAYQFFETEKDDSTIEDPVLRLRVAQIEKQQKIIFSRQLVPVIKEISIGNHWARYTTPQKPPVVQIPSQQLARYHYRYNGPWDYARRLLNQVEGFIMRKGESWLAGVPDSIGGGHVHYMYQQLKNGQYLSEYKRLLTIPPDRLEEGLASGRFVRIDDIARKIVASDL
ncbi:glycosyltransferase [bacterium]|nr:glycosyltransferase [bacterium]